MPQNPDSFTVQITAQYYPITAAVPNCNGQGDANVHAGQRQIRPGHMHHSWLSDSATEIGASEPMRTGDIIQRQESGINIRATGPGQGLVTDRAPMHNR